LKHHLEVASTVPTVNVFGLNAGDFEGICQLCSYSRTQAVNHLPEEGCGGLSVGVSKQNKKSMFAFKR
jgi:hypothetical protein